MVFVDSNLTEFICFNINEMIVSKQIGGDFLLIDDMDHEELVLLKLQHIESLRKPTWIEEIGN